MWFRSIKAAKSRVEAAMAKIDLATQNSPEMTYKMCLYQQKIYLVAAFGLWLPPISKMPHFLSRIRTFLPNVGYYRWNDISKIRIGTPPPLADIN